MITFAALVLSLFSAFNISTASAAEVRKVFDGSAAYCPPKETHSPIVPETALRAVVDGNDLEITLNVCNNGQWELDSNLPIHRYTAPNGDKVELHFENFRLVVQTLDWSQTKFISLSNFSSSAKARLAISDVEFVAAPALDLSLTAVRTTTTASGHTFKEDVTWGALRLMK